MKGIKRKWLFIVPGIIVVSLFFLIFQNLTNNVIADQGINASANLELTRTITNSSGVGITGGEIQQGESFSLNYKITPIKVQLSTPPTSKQIRISNITFTEILPANIQIDVDKLPSVFTSSGNLSTGYTITASLGDINYDWDTVSKSLIPDLTSNSGLHDGAISLSIPISSNLTSNYTFSNGSLHYNDLHEVSSVTSTSTPTPTPASTFDPTISSSGSPLGVVGDYSLFVFKKGSTTGNVTINGNLAVGEDLSLTNTSGGGTINGNVIVGENFNYYGANQNAGNGGNIEIFGNVIYGKTFNYGNTSLSGIKGTIPENPMKTIDFSTVKSYWTNKSKEYGMLQPNGTATMMYENQLYLEVTDKSLPYYIFEVNEEQISKAEGIIINTPENSTVLINIMGYKNVRKILDMSKWTHYNGKAVEYTNAFDSNGKLIKDNVGENIKKASKILYNFPEARRIKLTGGQIGTFLAPFATVDATNGNLTGSLVADSWDFGNNSGLLVNASSFKGELPSVPTPTPSPTVSPSPTNSPAIIPHVSQSFSSVSISVRSLRISGSNYVFINKSIDLSLITGNIPESANITWSLLGDGSNYATLTKVSNAPQKYKLTGKEIKDGIVISVTAGGITTTHTVNVIPYSLIGLRMKEEIEIMEGHEYNLNQLLWITPSEMTIDQIKKDLEWTSDSPSIASFDSPLSDEDRRGMIRGIKKGGPAIVTVLYIPSKGSTPIKTTIKVKVIANMNGDRY